MNRVKRPHGPCIETLRRPARLLRLLRILHLGVSQTEMRVGWRGG